MNMRRFGVITLLSALVLSAAISAHAQGAAIMARDEPVEGAGGGGATASSGYGGGSGRQATSAKGGRTAKTTKKAGTTNAVVSKTITPKPKAWNGFVIGDKYTFMNFEVVSAEKPYHTREAKANGASGLVQVEILIGADGSVVSAKARTGNKLLHPEAERAALASKFNRPTFGGKPARAIGFLVYRFGAEEDDNSGSNRAPAKRVAPAFDFKNNRAAN
jgi:hypothetical protein